VPVVKMFIKSASVSMQRVSVPVESALWWTVAENGGCVLEMKLETPDTRNNAVALDVTKKVETGK
jgi:hypothetical protein